ncbi:hypothetical protein [uncultured Pontibacter sp.]|uniref:hypothetical protein n=1 Tax=uncultured Pontibacter sp. TaxID=453356 RepID=UPI0026339A25|nr:hypothetical protein [uncultured Pontibacter sp.]
MFSFLIKRLSAAALLLLCVSCEVETVEVQPRPPEPIAVTYTIPQGQHTTQSPFKFIESPVMRFEATFDNSAVYATTDPKNQADINKLYGMSDCGSDHHSNSARFGWRWYANRLEIHAYTYQNKKRNTAYITTVELEKSSRYELEIGEREYIFRVNDTQVSMPRFCVGAAGLGYQLYPYFGGDETAPHTVTILIKDL